MWQDGGGMRQPQGQQQTKALDTMREVLGGEFLSLAVTDYQLRERFDEDQCTIEFNLVELSGVESSGKPGDRRMPLEGRGVGMLDAFFSGLCARYQPEHPSLGTIRFSSFKVRGLMGDAKAERATDAGAEATVGITNSSGTEFHFSALSPSVSHSSIEAVLAGIEYFVNSERAYMRLYKALRHHQSTGRPELVAKYTELLAQMVRNTSYSSAVERLKREG
jgi:hypothetical protein